MGTRCPQRGRPVTASKTTKSAGRRRGILKWSLLPLVAPLIALGVAFLETLPALEVSSARPPSLPLPSIEEMQEIATMKVHVSDITTAWDDDWKGAWLVEGDGLLSVDLDHATIERTQAPNGLRFVLPAPRAIQCRVDHERTELHGWVKKDWWTSDTRAAPFARRPWRKPRRS
jgi:hypothetical protein